MGATAREAEALVVTRWFDPGESGDPYSATVRFTGRRVGIRGNPVPKDTFVHEETIERIVPGSGPVSVAAWVYGLQPGEWSVGAELLRDGRRTVGAGPARRPLPPAEWSWRRWSLVAGLDAPVKTRWSLLAPLAGTPAVLPGIYTTLAAAGVVVALATQAAILAQTPVPVGQSLVASLIALVSGLIGAKLWYAVLHPDESIVRGGWAVDGFLIVAPLAVVLSLLAFQLPIGTVLDAATPGLFLAVAIGRVGCFLAGCCAGRCTRSRWGVWSSDRRVGARRIPTQLLESAAGLLIGLVSLLLVGLNLPIHGAIFVAAFAIYAIVRQLLLRVRAEQRKSSRTLPATAVAAAVVLLAVAVAQGVQAQ